MVYYWNKRSGFHYRRLFAMLLLCVMMFMSGCTPPWIKFPYDLCDTWVCENPRFSIVYSRDEAGWGLCDASMEWKDEVIDVEVNFSTSQFVVGPKSDPLYDNRLLSGSWEYEDGNLVLYIEEDFIFDNTVDKLVFVPQDE